MGEAILSDSFDKTRFLELLHKAYDGDLTEPEKQQINDEIKTRDQAVAAYLRFYADIAIIKMQSTPALPVQRPDDASKYNVILEEFAEYEKQAPGIEVPHQEPPRELIQKVVYPPRERLSFSKFQIFTFAACAATILFVVVFAKFAPSRPSTVETVMLADHINVEWGGSMPAPQIGNRLWTNDKMVDLKRGIIKLQYDDGVDVLIEGPASFEIERSGIFLEYGRLYGRVSEKGLGFRVETPTSQFIDQGTEFGIQAVMDGTSELHVIKGKVQFFAGSKGYFKTSEMIDENHAVQYDVRNNRVNKVAIQKTAFVRDINSNSGVVWRGQSSIDLTSILAGYDGFQPIGALRGLNLETGAFVSSVQKNNRQTKMKYTLVDQSPYIDGVFIPDGEKGPIQVTSAGHTLICPDTSGMATHDIAVFRGGPGNVKTIKPVILNGQQMGQTSEPIVLLHSNAGITFDLEEFRTCMPGVELGSFQAWGGLSEIVQNGGGIIDFWVLVDGQTRFERKSLRVGDGILSFTIDLNAQDRFLTLIVTDAAQDSPDIQGAYSDDFFYLVRPVLNLAAAGN